MPVWGLSLINGFAAADSAAGNMLGENDEGVAFARVPGMSTVEYTWPFLARRRGLYPLNGVAEVETSFPFGLFRARRPAEVTGRLCVWPETVFLAGLPDAAESQLSEERFSDRRVGEFGDILGTRLFREGDSLRRVHWAQTARQQTLIVTERQVPMMSCVQVVLDLSAESHPEEFRHESVEQCIRIAASLCGSLYRQHCRIELLAGSELFVIGASAVELQRAMDALAVLNVTSSTGPARSVHRRRKGYRTEFVITVTTDAGVQSNRPHQIVVNSGAVGEESGDCRDGAWIRIAARESLTRLAAIWSQQRS